MTRDDLNELGYIVPIETVPSILRQGILSHRRAQRTPHRSIADNNVQKLRAVVGVPNGRALHEYANLYLCPRNPMLYRRHDVHEEICVLRVSTDVLDLPGVVVTDMNAGSKYVHFRPGSGGLSIVNRDRTFARRWTHPDDQRDEWRDTSQKCAEVLVPDAGAPKYVVGAYVSCQVSRERLARLVPGLELMIDRDLFFL